MENTIYNPVQISERDQVHVFVTSSGIDVPEEFYPLFDKVKVRSYLIIEDFKILNGTRRPMEIYDDLSYKYGVCVSKVRETIRKRNELARLMSNQID